MTTRTVLAIAIAAGMALGACGSDDDSSATPQAATTVADAAASADEVSSSTLPPVGTSGEDTAMTEDSATPEDGATTDATATVMLATNPDLGEHLVDGDGRTLYLFAQDEGTTTACTGGCADNWPPFVADGTATAGDGLDAGLLSTADGILPDQVTYNDHLLYYFAGDQAPGDTNGVGLPDWYTVDAAGDAIEAN